MKRLAMLAACLLLWALPALAQVAPAADEDVLAPLDATVDKAVEPALRETAKAREALTALRARNASRAEIDAAERDLGAREMQLDQARIETLSRATGVPEARVAAMRDSGRGWGAIAGDLGAKPGILGVAAKGQAVKAKDQPDQAKGTTQEKGAGKKQEKGRAKGSNSKEIKPASRGKGTK